MVEERVLVLPPTAGDAELTRSLLTEAGMTCHICADIPELCRTFEQGAGAILLTEEAVGSSEWNDLVKTLQRQPDWSEVPVLLLTASGADSPATLEAMELLGNITVLERPVRVTTLVSALRTALRARRRQYEVCDHLEDVRASEAALRLQSEQFETLLNRAPLGVYLVDADFRIAQVNPVAVSVFGDIRDLIGRDFDEVMHILWNKEYADEVVRIFRHTLETGGSYITPECAEFRIDRNITEYYEWRVDRIPLPDGRFGVVCYFRDISNQVKARTALQELDQRKDEFIANMSHEIRSPLTGIMGYADLLLTRLKDPFEMQCLTTIKQSGSYLTEIVNDILDLSKIQAGKLVLDFERVSPLALFREVHELMEVRAREKRLPLILHFDGVLPTSIQTDPTRLRQILVNLVSNAIKFTERGRVEIVARLVREGELLQIDVIDTGIGIAPEHQQSLFQPFTQADTTSTRHYGGTGLGLTITKRLVELLGGSISFESEPDKGSTFRVTIPVGGEEITSESTKDGADVEALPAEPLRNRRVLVVDDLKSMCDLLSWYIKEAGGSPEGCHQRQSGGP
jgi:PAS domain S-box-containing protein